MNLLYEPLTGNGPAYRELSERVRNAILDGHLAPGTRIPPVMELAHSLDASVCTVQAALAPLVDEGLLERRPKHGTFVRNRAGALGGIGIYLSHQIDHRKDTAFSSELQHEILEEIKVQGGIPKVWFDSRSEGSKEEPLPEILQAIQRREIQGIIAAASDIQTQSWLSKTGIPFSLFGSANLPGKVWFRHTDIYELAFRELRNQGCKSVAIIASVSMKMLTSLTDENTRFFVEFEKSAASFGLTLKKEWLMVPPDSIDDQEYEQFGYGRFKSLWSQKERPDGLIVYPDLVARGVITAILERGIATVPNLKLVLHRNEGIPYLNPIPSTYLVFSPRQTAITLVDQLRRQIEGKGTRPIYLPFAVETF